MPRLSVSLSKMTLVLTPTEALEIVPMELLEENLAPAGREAFQARGNPAPTPVDGCADALRKETFGIVLPPSCGCGLTGLQAEWSQVWRGAVFESESLDLKV